MHRRGGLPASSLSDGKITLLTLIAALYFTRHQLLIFEDLGIPVYPNLMTTLVGMFYDAASRAQLSWSRTALRSSGTTPR